MIAIASHAFANDEAPFEEVNKDGQTFYLVPVDIMRNALLDGELLDAEIADHEKTKVSRDEWRKSAEERLDLLIESKKREATWRGIAIGTGAGVAAFLLSAYVYSQLVQ